eukprot:m.282583 g.282583  ORF g.282583 m.282583 type:complete len:91 (+) comp125130_c0_seq1:112-384(+)
MKRKTHKEKTNKNKKKKNNSGTKDFFPGQTPSSLTFGLRSSSDSLSSSMLGNPSLSEDMVLDCNEKVNRGEEYIEQPEGINKGQSKRERE